jgi:transcriptional regulator with XRE-family HTH domain
VADRATKLLKRFGETIRVERLARGLTQEQLAEKADLSLNYIGTLERGEQMASLDSIVRLAEAMKLKPSGLLELVGM